MKNITIIGAGLGLNGCQISRLQAESIRLADYEIISSNYIHELSNLICSKFEKDRQTLSAMLEDDSIYNLSNYFEISLKAKVKNFDDKDVKLKRQQHRWAQINYKNK